MRKFAGFTRRNLLVFFKDKQAVAFSMLTSVIVLVTYLLFIKGTFTDAINSILDSVPGIKAMIRAQDIDTYCNLLLFTGILGSALVTVPCNCLSVIVKDRENGIDRDIMATPVGRWQIILSYFTSAVLSAFLLNGVILTAGLAAFACMGDLYLGAADVVAAYGIVALGSVSSAAFFMIVMLFFRSSAASGAFFGMLSAAAGFVIGAYIPLSQFSESVRTACCLFPASHVTCLLRGALLDGVLEEMAHSLNGADHGMFADTMKEVFAFEADIMGHSLSTAQMTAYVAALSVVCAAVMTGIYGKTYQRK